MGKTIGFLKFDIRVLKFELGGVEEKFYMYLIRKENRSRLYPDHIIGQVELTVRTVAKDIDVTENIARRLIRQFSDIGIIELLEKSNSKTKPSLYKLTVYNTVENAVDNTVKNNNITQLKIDKSTISVDKAHSKNTVNHTVSNTVNHTSKINNKINNKIDMYNKKKKYDPIDNPHYQKYDDLEERLLKLQANKKKV